ncbi:hypothetical protein PSN45_004287 [Yamadazyma tenuis]|uniref:Uncharacterized protein n=1 Tax=Candida tenuis (strain ATCC 10573 / BCRC 21748 / CBS 615 / JCM 9827 / NBRC 10315 / NRRL Y-1498 / VKM Y-70) TaxID=590646 RepID=G3B6C1_CANTC|nr:uncharacterized protein CANTEDRAFT_130885 [Yamadazyma tenuis ATCC 10573]XP_006687226.1 uncharacterized protein CANTEDRAFT_130885 [Yamadazyma tenuis ATCC 10573]EGV63432.1 hypothetical protein CANTEDRAFT_130885 [Yamadazyma tenuis ATCC 10573]EGV63433.1 hypothetical protein CANTEDRAFT_130885 [Yamadazyma tenuis ATCC 10573]WEJ96744.1 hypothetical protein PSN45_004287 [Yamadazyma tenuis]
MASQEQVYIEYLNYDWDSFAEFQNGLEEILDNYLQNLQESDPSVTAIPALDKQQLIDQAKSFFYCSHTGNILNLDDFLQWKQQNGDKFVKDHRISEMAETIPENIVQQQLPNITTNSTSPNATTTTTSTDEPPYSSNYQHLVELIMSGTPVPGIKEIPDTILPEKSSTPSAAQRVKPWEKGI